MALDVTVMSKLSAALGPRRRTSCPCGSRRDQLDNEWIKAAAAQVRTTVRQAMSKVDRIGNGKPGRTRRPDLDDVAAARDCRKGKDPGADNE